MVCLPASIRAGHHWGYVGVDGDKVYGTALLPTAPRTVSGRHLSDETYRSQQPVVTSRALFRVDIESGQTAWIYRRGAIINTTIVVDDGLICLIEGLLFGRY